MRVDLRAGRIHRLSVAHQGPLRCLSPAWDRPGPGPSWSGRWTSGWRA